MMSDRTRRRTGRAAVLILALLLCEPVLWGLGRPPAPAGARSLPPGIDGTDHRVALDSAAWPWAAIGRVNRAVGGFCTGTLVAPRAVLTAAHCLYDARRRHWIAAGDLHFLAGYRRGAWLAHGVAKAVVLPPGYRPEAPLTPASLAEDWAVLVLAEPLAISPVPVRALPGPASVPDGTSLSRAGYSQDRAHMLSIHAGCGITGAAEGGRLLLHDCDATHGDSGSPLLLRGIGGTAVIGIEVALGRPNPSGRGIAVPAGAFAKAVEGAPSP